MKKVGLTGGIGVGKTYVAEIFQQMGVPVFNADVEAKKCLVEDSKLMIAVRSVFGENIYANGVLQKDELAKIVFNNNEKLAEKCRSLRNLCFKPEQRFVHDELGWNYRFTNLQAALGLAKMEQLEKLYCLKWVTVLLKLQDIKKR